MDFSPLDKLPCLVLSLWYFPYVYFSIYVYARAVSSSPLGRCPDFPLDKSSMRLLSVRAAVLYDFIVIFKNEITLFIYSLFSIIIHIQTLFFYETMDYWYRWSVTWSMGWSRCGCLFCMSDRFWLFLLERIRWFKKNNSKKERTPLWGYSKDRYFLKVLFFCRNEWCWMYRYGWYPRSQSKGYACSTAMTPGKYLDESEYLNIYRWEG